MAEVAPAVSKAVVDAYYPEVLKAAESARTRAQAGYTIAGAVAAAIVAAGVFGNLDKEHGWVQGLGVAALTFWLGAALVYIYAVAGTVALPSFEAAPTVEVFVGRVLGHARTERNKIEDRTTAALVATGVAVILTLATLIAALVTTAPTPMKQGTLVLTTPGTQAVGKLCGGQPATVAGKTDPAALDAAFVKVELDPGCGGRTKPVTVRLAKGSIAGFATD